MTWPSVAPLDVDVRLRGRVRNPVRPIRPPVSCHVSTILPAVCSEKARETRVALASKSEQREHLEARVCGDEGRHRRRSERRADLDTVEPAEIEPGERADVGQGLATRRTADLRRAGPGR